MWVEQTPKIGDTVKVEFAEFTNLGTKIGVVDKYFMGFAVVDFGDCKRYLPMLSTFFVYVK